MQIDEDIKDVNFRKGELLSEELSPLHQICPKKGQTLRIALLSEFCKPKGSTYHWYRNNFYRCNSPKDGPDAECCQKVQRSWTCVSLALVYLNADTKGNIERGSNIQYRVGYVGLARTAYQEVSEYQSEAPGCDLLYSNDDHYNIGGASRIPRWKESPQAGEVTREAQRWADGKKLSEKLGKKLSDVEWHRLITTGMTLEPEEE
jgi:hypothetical protein